jgi:hypothetical protein
MWLLLWGQWFPKSDIEADDSGRLRVVDMKKYLARPAAQAQIRALKRMKRT